MNTESNYACSSNGACSTSQESEAKRDTRKVTPDWHSQRDGDDVVLAVSLPGVQKEDLEISARENRVSLRAPRSFPEGTGVTYELSLRLARDLDPGSAKAVLTNGVLDLRFARREEAKSRPIAVEG